MRYVLGVDGGATKTFALLGDTTGRICALGRGGPGNHQTLGGVGRAMKCIAEAVEEACRSANIASADLVHVAFCLAGADLPSDYALLGEAIRKRWPGLAFTIKNDSFAGLRAGARKGWGVVSICGTGTCAAGIAPDGRELQVGGLGYLFGDFGGAADLGREAIRAAFMACEQRGPTTALVAPVLEGMGFPEIDRLREALYLGTAELSRIPTLAPRVFATASEGDSVAQEILIRMGTLLGQSACGVIRQLGLREQEVDVVLAGSTWKGNNPLMIDAFRLAIHRLATRAHVIRSRYEPVVGAWLLALEAIGIQPDLRMYQAIESTLSAELTISDREEYVS